MRPTVLLWDIDGTLIGTAGAGRQAIVQTFEARFGRGDVFDFPFDGMTDPAILGLGLAALGQSAQAVEEALPETIAAYLEVLASICTVATHFRVHDGVQAALELTHGRPGFAVGLGTGNVADGARLKLERVNLHRYFDFGGYGSDHIDRARLLAIGADRGAARLGVSRADSRVVVIGDTPKDIAAAKAIGAESIAVATGSFSVEALRTFEPTLAVPVLTHPDAAPVLLGSLLASR